MALISSLLAYGHSKLVSFLPSVSHLRSVLLLQQYKISAPPSKHIKIREKLLEDDP
jgi:hypothetical protein